MLQYVLYVKSATADEGYTISEADATKSNVYEFSAGGIDYSTVYTSNVTLSTTGGTNASTAKVKIDSSSYSAIKIGTGTQVGALQVNVPAGTTKLHLHAVAWNGVSNLYLKITGATCSPNSIALTANSGVKSSTPFTLSLPLSNDYFEIELSNITEDTTLTFTTSKKERSVVWGVNAE